MAKRILLNALQSAFADYVVGLSDDKLKLGVWSGEIELHDLQVNETGINQLQLPVKVIHGTVKIFRVSIPWTSLDRNPVKVYIDGIYLLVGPIQKEEWAASEVKERRLSMKRQRIAAAEKEGSKNSSSSSSSGVELSANDKGYLERLVQKIVDNLEITIKNIHVRYEDTSLSLPDSDVAAVGIALDEFIVCTTGADFKKEFIDRTGRNATTLVHKLANVSGFHVYWQCSGAESIASLPCNKRQNALIQKVKIGDHTILSPESFRLMVVHNDDPKDTAGPKYHATLLLKGFNGVIAAEQIQQAFVLSDSLLALRNWSIFYPFRPQKSVKEDPRAWWRFAFICVSKKPEGWQSTLKILKVRSEYVSLHLKSLEGRLTVDADFKLTQNEKERIDILEDELPISAILMFRQMAEHQFKKSRHYAQGNKAAKEPNRNAGWFGGLFGGGKKSVNDDEDLQFNDLISSAIQQEASRMEKNSKSLPDSYSEYSAVAQLDGNFRILGKERAPLIKLVAAVKAGGSYKHNGDIIIDFQMSHFTAKDLFTPSAIFPNIISMDKTSEERISPSIKSVERGNDVGAQHIPVNASIFLSKNETSIILRSKPIVVAYNREVIGLLLGLLKGREAAISNAASTAAFKRLEEARAQAQALLQRSNKIKVQVDSAAPKIIVPISSTQDIGFLHLDCGYLTVIGGTELKGKVRDDRMLMWDISLSDISLSLPSRVAAQKTQDHFNALIEPFTVKAIINNERGSQPEKQFVGIPVTEDDRSCSESQPVTTVMVSIEPRLRGLLSAKKIEQLLSVVDYITQVDGEVEADAAKKLSLRAGLLSVPESAPVEDFTNLSQHNIVTAARAQSDSSITTDANQETNPFTRMLSSVVSIPSVELALVQDVEANLSSIKRKEILHLVVGGLRLDISQRPHDMYIKFTLRELSLDDMQRSRNSNLRRMIYSGNSIKDVEFSRELIRIDFVQTANEKSPLIGEDSPLKSYESLAKLEFTTLVLSLNSSCLDALTPFYRALIRVPSDFSGPFSDTVKRRKSLESGTASIFSGGQRKGWGEKVQKEIIKKQQQKSMLVELSVDEVSLELIAMKPEPEPMLKASILDFEVGAKMEPKSGKILVDLMLTSIDLKDIRKAAKNNAFKTILAPKRSLSKGSGLSGKINQPPLLSLNYEGTASSGSVDIKVRNFTCNLMAEPICQSLELAMEVQAAVLRMVIVDEADAQIPKQHPKMGKRASLLVGSADKGENQNIDSKAAGKQHAKSTAAPKDFELKVNATLEGAKLQLIQDASNSSSRFLVLKTSLSSKFCRIETTKDQRPGTALRDDKIEVNLLHLESYVDSESPKNFGGKGRLITQILKPFSGHAVLATLGDMQGNLASVSVSAMLDAVEARVSYMDVMFILEFIKEAAPTISEFNAKDDDLSDDDDPAADIEEEGYCESSTVPQNEAVPSIDSSEAKAICSYLVNLSWSSVCLILVNDYKGQGVPVLSGVISKMKFTGSGILESFNAEASLSSEISFFNSLVGHWEPLLEKWPLELKLVLKEKGRCAISVEACKVLIINVTSDFLNSILTTYSTLFAAERSRFQQLEAELEKEPLLLAAKYTPLEYQWADENEEKQTKHGNEFQDAADADEESNYIVPAFEELQEGKYDTSISLINETGLTLMVSTTDLKVETAVPPGSKAALAFLKQGSNSSFEERNLSRKYVRIGWFSESAEGVVGLDKAREPLRRLPVDRINTCVFPIVPVNPTAAEKCSALGGPVVEEAWQNQRFDNVRRIWKGTSVPRDRPEWSTKEWDTSKGTGILSEERRLETILLPDAHDWEWRDEWHIDESRIYGDPENQTDEEGWEYAIDFSHFAMVNRSRTWRELDQARRRRWIRTRSPRTKPLEDTMRPLLLTWEVFISPQGYLTTIARSTVQIANATRLKLEIVALCSAWGSNTAYLGMVCPGDTLNVPILLSCATHYRLRPVNEDSNDNTSFSWCSPFPVILNHIDTEKNFFASCVTHDRNNKESSTVHLVVHLEAQVNNQLSKFVVLPPVVISNALPCSFVYRLFQDVASPTEEVIDEESISTSISAAMEEKRAEYKSTISTGKVQPAGTQYLMNISSPRPKLVTFFQIGIACYGWSTKVPLLPLCLQQSSKSSQSDSEFIISLPDGNGGMLELQCKFETLMNGPNRHRCPSLLLHISVPLWLIDRTGLNLNFSYEKGRKSCFVPQPGVPTSRLCPLKEGNDVPTLSDIVSKGSIPYIIGNVEAGCKIYVDGDYVFNLDTMPSFLIGCQFIQTAYADRSLILESPGSRQQQQPLVSFKSSNAPASVCLLIDSKLRPIPSWVSRSGFRLIGGQVQAFKVVKSGAVRIINFYIYSRCVNEGSAVRLGSNKSQSKGSMFVPVLCRRFLREVAIEDDFLSSESESVELEKAWVSGSSSLFMSQKGSGDIAVGIKELSKSSSMNLSLENYQWSDMVTAEAGQQGVFALKASGRTYELALKMENLVGRFRESLQITVIPRYRIVNLLQSRPIYVRQKGVAGDFDIKVDSSDHLPWHWPDSRADKEVEFRTSNSGWSFGSVDISKVSTTPLLLPVEGGNCVVHIDVKLTSDPKVDEQAILIVVWAASKKKHPMYRLRNHCTSKVKVHQVVKGERLEMLQTINGVFIVHPEKSMEVGWPYPDAAPKLSLSAATSNQSSEFSKAVELNTERVGHWVRVSGKKSETDVYAQIQVEDGTKVILITNTCPGTKPGASGDGDLYQEAASTLAAEAGDPDLDLTFRLKGIGLSIIGPQYPLLEKSGQVRRAELVYGQLSNVNVNLSKRHMIAFKLNIGSVQLDNHMDSSPFPVIFCPRDVTEMAGVESSNAKREASKVPFIDFRLIAMAGIDGDNSTYHYEYIAFRMLDAEISQDHSSLTSLIALAMPVITNLSHKAVGSGPDESRYWLENHTAELLSHSEEEKGGYCDVEQVRMHTQARREFFKAINFHPFLFTLTWLKDRAPKELENQVQLPILGMIPTVHRSKIALTSYLVEYAFGVRDELIKNIIKHYTTQSIMQVLKLVGSLRVLGSPADLVSGVGSGAKALLYSPISANILEPVEFFRAIGGGAGAFAMAAVHGVFNTVAGVAEGVTNAAACLVLDEEYQRRREAKQVRQITGGSGLIDGISKGTKNITGGIKEGFTGIFVTPAKGAKNAGVGGFFKGVGHGVVGAVAKPVVGVTDGVVSVLQGISNESDAVAVKSHLRPRRALDCTAGSAYGILVPFSKEAAEAQDLLVKERDDVYLNHYQMYNGYLLVMGEKNLILKSSISLKLKSEISHVETTTNGILLIMYHEENIELPSNNEQEVRSIYEKLYELRHIMGNPTKMVSINDALSTYRGHKSSSSTVDLIDQSSPSKKTPKMERSASVIESFMSAISTSMNAYTFGRVNSETVPYVKMSESEVIEQAEQKLKCVGLGNWNALDFATWSLICQWNSNHSGLYRSRCLAVVLINLSTTTAHVTEITKHDGMGWRLLQGPQCDIVSKQLMPGGAAVLFAWGYYMKSLMKRGTVEIMVDSNAFRGFFSAERGQLQLTSYDAFCCGFLEETISEWYSKLVVIIKGTQDSLNED